MRGIYIHIPFCVRKCPYCDFYSVTDFDARYIGALIDEMREYKGESADSVFIGGGTPTSIGNALLDVVYAVRENFNLSADCEFSVEANPGAAESALLRELYSAGVNRLSIGAQSFRDDELAQLGRIHRAKDIYTVFDAARAAGFSNINLDLMCATPHQTVKSLAKTLDEVIKLSPTHVSAYSLIIEEGTPFYEAELDLPPDNEEREMYFLVGERLATSGFSRYEISNYARRGFECRHNLKYWTREEYIGLGAAASSFYGGARYDNAADIAAYIKGEGRKINYTPIDSAEALNEYFMLGLRLKDGVEYHGEFPEKIEKLLSVGLIEHFGSRIRLTARGTDVANLVFMEFV